MVADPGEGVPIDRSLGQLGQGGPGLEATGVRGGNGRDGGPALGRGERRRAARSASSSSALIGSSTVSGLPLVNWTECSVAMASC